MTFDTVFVAGLNSGEFPSFLAERDGRVEEERRLFYVAMTRARRRLFLSGHARNERGYECRPSAFVADVP
jgi:DNA helicase-2/ATP-dependent DNA helicase PcrA